MKLPNFIVAGFPKCGSTSLYYYLYEHPEIFLPKQKELHYFTYDIIKKQDAGKNDKAVKRFHYGSLKEYKKLYKEAKNEKAVGDVSPSYANYPSVIPKIKDTLGNDTKVIITLRDPIKRAYSNYLHLVREGRESLPFYEALLAEETRREQQYSDFWYYTFNSLYAEKIKQIKANFDNVLIITFEEFVRDQEKGIREIYNFLEVSESFIPENLDTQFNPGGVYEANTITKFIFGQNKLKTLIKKTVPLTSTLKQIKIKTINKYKKPTPGIDQRSEAFLVEIFKEDVKRLKEFGVKTQYWNEKLTE
ncbi:sulfotransferase family protein [Constantimarinum furrinae]|uniref:Sulfotransferase n=1 Tax=Constantimarinum furrinae TaxID=2562285 RepID=A0A7G8PT14_9FLAO|nr:sulfotransferase [Constantimarinum furrinae]QNJ97480.1 Sulfotransferase [Constantimarinum furrinae]